MDIPSPAAGTVSRMLVKEGDRVSEGHPVLKLRTVSGIELLSLRHPELGSFAVARDWTAVKAKIAADMSAIKGEIAEAKHQRDVKHAAHRADCLEWEAAFAVDYAGVPISTWEYDLAVDGDGCTVTERWTDRRPRWMQLGSIPVMGVRDRAAHNRAIVAR